MRDYKWFVNSINKEDQLGTVLKIWKEAEEHLEVQDLVKVHEECHQKIVESIRMAVNTEINKKENG
jgi:hypothetical protein